MRKLKRRDVFSAWLLLALLVSDRSAWGVDFPWPFNGSQASAEATFRSDLRRRSQIAMQIATIQHLRWPVWYLGDIWGDPWCDYVEQPIGRVEFQTGPNRWESRPVYLRPVPAPPMTRPKSSGPREF
jgi:hypothetical protein